MRGLTRSLLRLGALGLLFVFTGCYTAEVRSAQDAIDAARKAGKDKECPSEFDAADQMVKRAEALCQTCQTKEANALAADAMGKIQGLCPAKYVAPPTPPPPPAAPSPTASLSASPASVDAGGCSTLSWSTSNANNVSIDGGVGSVDSSGSRQVCPGSTTTYTLSASGAGGSRSSSATVTVKSAPKLADKLTIHVNFDTNKSDIKASEVADLQKAEAFVRKYSTCKIEIDGYTDSTGSDKINNPLSERRAEAVQKWILDHGATSSDHITVKGNGSSNPVASNKTAKGRAENRRAELLAFCE
jgi:OOP family OmpA-OmpF porin